ncbi:hypothetical protein CCH79_00010050 [Gambusia affinis]|uniref:Pleckstrin homology-like domain family A member 2 n=2 Tax=Gambusia affinis TaxID=33528 RepID=A0A315VNF8_GAMAF|nr:hypothetical protein CCH79_00010050 [Gambusia affinis]
MATVYGVKEGKPKVLQPTLIIFGASRLPQPPPPTAFPRHTPLCNTVQAGRLPKVCERGKASSRNETKHGRCAILVENDDLTDVEETIINTLYKEDRQTDMSATTSVLLKSISTCYDTLSTGSAAMPYFIVPRAAWYSLKGLTNHLFFFPRIHRVLIMRLIVNTVQLHVSTCPPSSGMFRSFHSPSCHTHEPTAARLHNSETNMGDENRSINVQSFGLHSYFCPYEFIKSRPLLLQVMPYLTSSLKDCLVCGETVGVERGPPHPAPVSPQVQEQKCLKWFTVVLSAIAFDPKRCGCVKGSVLHILDYYDSCREAPSSESSDGNAEEECAPHPLCFDKKTMKMPAEEIIKEGDLEKRSDSFLQFWKKKTCVLTKDSLNMYADVKRSKVKELKLQSIKKVDCVERTEKFMYFTIVTKDDKEIDFRYSTEQACWHAEITLALINYQNREAVQDFKTRQDKESASPGQERRMARAP